MLSHLIAVSLASSKFVNIVNSFKNFFKNLVVQALISIKKFSYYILFLFIIIIFLEEVLILTIYNNNITLQSKHTNSTEYYFGEWG